MRKPGGKVSCASSVSWKGDSTLAPFKKQLICEGKILNWVTTPVHLVVLRIITAKPLSNLSENVISNYHQYLQFLDFLRFSSAAAVRAAIAIQQRNREPEKVLCLVVPAVINPTAVAAQLGLVLQPEEESFRKNLRWSLWPVATRKYYFQSTCVHSRWHWKWLAYWLNLSLYLKKIIILGSLLALIHASVFTLGSTKNRR